MINFKHSSPPPLPLRSKWIIGRLERVMVKPRQKGLIGRVDIQVECQ